MQMTTIETPRLALRSLRTEDQPHLCELDLSPGVSDFLGRVSTAPVNSRGELFVIWHQGTFAGIAGLLDSDAFDGTEVELICAVGTAFRNRRFALEACEAVLDWAAKTKRFRRILACVDETNAHGLKLAKRLGFQYHGPRRFRNQAIYAVAFGDE